jgi:chromosome segregation ATPase
LTTRQRSSEAQQNQEQLEEQIGELERLLAKVETLAASENSRQNSTPEVRKINQRIEEPLEEVQRVETKASALALDVSYLEHEIESTRTDFEERKNAASILLENRYKSIQEIRHELANARRTSLQTYLERHQKHAAQEIEFVRLQTNVLVYRQLLTSVQLEVNCLNSRDQSAVANLRRELEQVELAIKQIPIHDPLDTRDVTAVQRSCEDWLKEINATETELKEYIIKMSQAEGSQDKLAKEIQQAEDMNESLRVGLAAEDTQMGELEREIETTKMKTDRMNLSIDATPVEFHILVGV